jgi:hypothetical protein
LRRNRDQKEDVEGVQFGRLLAVGFTGKKTKSGKPLLECWCACGKTVLVDQYNLTRGKTESCGCLRTERIVASCAVPDAGFRGLYQQYQNSAEVRGIAWELTEEQFRKLTQSPCHYTGRAPASVFTSSNSHLRRRKHSLPPSPGGVYVYNGVDRLDSSVGYTVSNCVAACGDANLAKQSLTHDEFIALCKEIAIRHQ